MAMEIRTQICLGPITGLPKDVVVEIILRTSSVKTIALCKYVCKAWRGLISDPQFAKLHFARSKICLLVRNPEEQTAPRTVLLFEDENGHLGFHPSKCVCRPRTKTESCDVCRHDTTAVTELKIPTGQLWAKTIANTCDGLLCLYSQDSSSIVVCNPVTGEFVTLPDHGLKFQDMDVVVSALGLDPNTGRYKVVVMYSERTARLIALKATVHVLGTDSWRELETLDDVSLNSTYLSGPALLNGALHWVYTDEESETNRTVSFDLASERLRYRSLPPFPLLEGEPSLLAVATLGDRLCAYLSHPAGMLNMCLIDERDFSSDGWITHDLPEVQLFLNIIRSLDDGAMLMYNGPFNELVYYDPPRGGPRFKRLRFAEEAALEIVAYTPSFISLEDIVTSGNSEVLNVYSEVQY